MFKDPAIILDAIRPSFLNKSATAAMFYLSSSRFWTATSLVIFYHLLSVSKSRKTTYKRLIGSEPHSHKPFAPVLVFLSHIDRLLNKTLWQLSISTNHDV
jgi:hypothetical protein